MPAGDGVPAGPDDEIIWIAPGKHLVQYPIRRGELYNQVAVFGSPSYSREAELTDRWGTPVERDAAHRAHPAFRQDLGQIWHDGGPVVPLLRDRILTRRGPDDYIDLDWLYQDQPEAS